MKLLPKVKFWLPNDVHDFSFEISESRDDLIAKAKAAIEGSFDAFLSLGGDGTLHDIVSIATENSPAIGVLPCGRGNDFTRSLGYPNSLQAICEGFSHPTTRVIDLPTVNGVPFLSIAGVGFDGMVSQMTRDGRCKLGGTVCYIWYLLKALFRFHPIGLHIELEGQKIDGRFMLAAAANGQYYGGGMRFAPDAVLDDGLLDVILVREMPMWKLACKFPKVYTGKHIHEAEIQVEHARTITFTSEQDVEMFADGEFLAKLPVMVEIGLRKARVLVPENNETIKQ